jgi:hypothetical protein
VWVYMACEPTASSAAKFTINVSVRQCQQGTSNKINYIYISLYIIIYLYIYKYIPWQPKRKVANVWNEVHNQVPACLGCTNTWFLTFFDSCSYSFGNHLKAHTFVMESYSHQTSTHERVAVTKIKTCINNK